MKEKKIVIVLSLILAAVIAAVIILICAFPQNGGAAGIRQNISYTESVEKIDNPDQGFYRPLYVKVTEDGAQYNKTVVNSSARLYHLRIDISAFSKAVNGKSDKLLSLKAINGLKDTLDFLKLNDKNAIVRFAYDPSYGGKADCEPALQIILEHVKQVCPVLNEFETTITAIETGLIGPWGEMHSSAIANAANITPIIETYLSNTHTVPVLVRTPKMIYDYLGIELSEIDGYKIQKSDKAYRLGVFNDGYLGSDSDLGTFTDREREIEFLKNQTDHLPYGGEVVVPEGTLHDIENCTPEMAKINLSYLNVEWNYQVLDKWKNTFYTPACGNDSAYYNMSAFTYVQNRMGYRLLITDCRFLQSAEKLQINLKISNKGFGNLNKAKLAKIILTDENGSIKYTRQVENFTVNEEKIYDIDLNLQSGKYYAYLCVYGEEIDGDCLYCVQFANENIWNETLKANKLGEIEI